MGAPPEIAIPDTEKEKESIRAEPPSGGGFRYYLVGRNLRFLDFECSHSFTENISLRRSIRLDFIRNLLRYLHSRRHDNAPHDNSLRPVHHKI
jgi:hypothetical protein